MENEDNDDDADGVGAQPALGHSLIARLLPRVQEQQELGHRWPVKDDVSEEGKAAARAWVQLTPCSFFSSQITYLRGWLSLGYRSGTGFS